MAGLPQFPSLNHLSDASSGYYNTDPVYPPNVQAPAQAQYVPHMVDNTLRNLFRGIPGSVSGSQYAMNQPLQTSHSLQQQTISHNRQPVISHSLQPQTLNQSLQQLGMSQSLQQTMPQTMSHQHAMSQSRQHQVMTQALASHTMNLQGLQQQAMRQPMAPQAMSHSLQQHQGLRQNRSPQSVAHSLQQQQVMRQDRSPQSVAHSLQQQQQQQVMRQSRSPQSVPHSLQQQQQQQVMRQDRSPQSMAHGLQQHHQVMRQDRSPQSVSHNLQQQQQQQQVMRHSRSPQSVAHSLQQQQQQVMRQSRSPQSVALSLQQQQQQQHQQQQAVRQSRSPQVINQNLQQHMKHNLPQTLSQSLSLQQAMGQVLPSQQSMAQQSQVQEQTISHHLKHILSQRVSRHVRGQTQLQPQPVSVINYNNQPVQNSYQGSSYLDQQPEFISHSFNAPSGNTGTWQQQASNNSKGPQIRVKDFNSMKKTNAGQISNQRTPGREAGAAGNQGHFYGGYTPANQVGQHSTAAASTAFTQPQGQRRPDGEELNHYLEQYIKDSEAVAAVKKQLPKDVTFTLPITHASRTSNTAARNQLPDQTIQRPKSPTKELSAKDILQGLAQHGGISITKRSATQGSGKWLSDTMQLSPTMEKPSPTPNRVEAIRTDKKPASPTMERAVSSPSRTVDKVLIESITANAELRSGGLTITRKSSSNKEPNSETAESEEVERQTPDNELENEEQEDVKPFRFGPPDVPEEEGAREPTPESPEPNTQPPVRVKQEPSTLHFGEEFTDINAHRFNESTDRNAHRLNESTDSTAHRLNESTDKNAHRLNESTDSNAHRMKESSITNNISASGPPELNTPKIDHPLPQIPLSNPDPPSRPATKTEPSFPEVTPPMIGVPCLPNINNHNPPSSFIPPTLDAPKIGPHFPLVPAVNAHKQVLPGPSFPSLPIPRPGPLYAPYLPTPRPSPFHHFADLNAMKAQFRPFKNPSFLPLCPQIGFPDANTHELDLDHQPINGIDKEKFERLKQFAVMDQPQSRVRVKHTPVQVKRKEETNNLLQPPPKRKVGRPRKNPQTDPQQNLTPGWFGSTTISQNKPLKITYQTRPGPKRFKNTKLRIPITAFNVNSYHLGAADTLFSAIPVASDSITLTSNHNDSSRSKGGSLTAEDLKFARKVRFYKSKDTTKCSNCGDVCTSDKFWMNVVYGKVQCINCVTKLALNIHVTGDWNGPDEKDLINRKCQERFDCAENSSNSAVVNLMSETKRVYRTLLSDSDENDTNESSMGRTIIPEDVEIKNCRIVLERLPANLRKYKRKVLKLKKKKRKYKRHQDAQFERDTRRAIKLSLQGLLSKMEQSDEHPTESAGPEESDQHSAEPTGTSESDQYDQMTAPSDPDGAEHLPGPISTSEYEEHSPEPNTAFEHEEQSPAATTTSEYEDHSPGPNTGSEQEENSLGPNTESEHEEHSPAPNTTSEHEEHSQGPNTSFEQEEHSLGPNTGSEHEDHSPSLNTTSEHKEHLQGLSRISEHEQSAEPSLATEPERQSPCTGTPDWDEEQVKGILARSPGHTQEPQQDMQLTQDSVHHIREETLQVAL